MNFLKEILVILGLWIAPLSPPPILFPIATTTTSSSTSTTTSSTTSTTTSLMLPTVTTTILAVVPDDDIWWLLALCEDGGKNRWYPPYSGYFHFLPSTYYSVGGINLPHEDDYETQKGFAIKLQRRDGWNPWPGCARKLGLPLR